MKNTNYTCNPTTTTITPPITLATVITQLKKSNNQPNLNTKTTKTECSQKNEQYVQLMLLFGGVTFLGFIFFFMYNCGLFGVFGCVGVFVGVFGLVVCWGGLVYI